MYSTPDHGLQILTVVAAVVHVESNLSPTVSAAVAKSVVFEPCPPDHLRLWSRISQDITTAGLHEHRLQGWDLATSHRASDARMQKLKKTHQRRLEFQVPECLLPTCPDFGRQVSGDIKEGGLTVEDVAGNSKTNNKRTRRLTPLTPLHSKINFPNVLKSLLPALEELDQLLPHCCMLSTRTQVDSEITLRVFLLIVWGLGLVGL